MCSNKIKHINQDLTILSALTSVLQWSLAKIRGWSKEPDLNVPSLLSPLKLKKFIMKSSQIPLSELTKKKNNPETDKVGTQIDQIAPCLEGADRGRPLQVGRCTLKIPTHHLSIISHQIVGRLQDRQCETPQITNTDLGEVLTLVLMTVNIQLRVKS